MGQIERALARAAAKRLQEGKEDPKRVSDLLPPARAQPGLGSHAQVEVDPELLRQNRIVWDDSSPWGESYKMLRTRVLQRMRHHGWNTLGVTGTSPGEGKTLTAINLSLNIARDVNTQAVLVDLDLRRPAIHRYLGISPKPDLGDYFETGIEPEEIMVNPGRDRLALLLNDTAFPNSSEMLSSPQMASLVKQLRGPGRVVVFDLPPLLTLDDALAFCPLVDALLLVVSQGMTKRDDLLAVKDLLQEVNVVGVVLNRSTEHVAPYYYDSYS